jgi:hypothetical protein
LLDQPVDHDGGSAVYVHAAQDVTPQRKKCKPRDMMAICARAAWR